MTGVTINTPDSNTLSVGSQVQLGASVEPEGATDSIVWSSSDETVATVDSTGKVTAEGPGTVTITATAGSVTDTVELTVVKPVTAISLSDTTKAATVGTPFTLTATVTPSDAYNATVAWSTSDAAVATVVDGVVTPRAAGNVDITASAGGFSATCKVTVSDPVVVPVEPTSITLDKTTLSLAGATSERLTATVGPDDATDKTVTWASSDGSVCAVDATGTVTATGKGAATVTASTSNGVSATCAVTVTNPPTSLTLSGKQTECVVGQTFEVTATVKGDLPGAVEESESYAWESSDNSVLGGTFVGNKATLIGKAPGTSKVSVRARYGGKDAATSEFTVKVSADAPRSITLSETEKTIEFGTAPSFTLTATILPETAAATPVLWSSSNESVATVDGNGTVKLIREGESTIRAAVSDALFAECRLTVTKPTTPVIPVESVTLSEHEVTLVGRATHTLSATVLPNDATYREVQWSSSDRSVVTVSAEGKLMTVGKGEATITAYTDFKKDECKVTVKNPVSGVSVSPSSATLVRGDSASLKAAFEAPLAGAFDALESSEWTSSDPSICAVAGSGADAKITGTAAGSATISFKARTEKGELSAAAAIKVTRPAPSKITLSETMKDVGLDAGGFSLTAAVEPADADYDGITWASSDPSVLTVNGNGVVELHRAGYASVSATAGGVVSRCSVTVRAYSASTDSDSPVQGSVFANDKETMELLRGLHPVIQISDRKKEGAFNQAAIGSAGPTSFLSEAYEVWLADDSGKRVPWNHPENPLTVRVTMGEAMAKTAQGNALQSHYVSEDAKTTEPKVTWLDGGDILFETTHFSTYAIMAMPPSDADANGGPMGNGANVGGQPSTGGQSGGGGLAQTGDALGGILAGISVVVFVVAGVAVALGVARRRKVM